MKHTFPTDPPGRGSRAPNPPGVEELDDIWMIQGLHDRHLLHNACNLSSAWDREREGNSPSFRPKKASQKIEANKIAHKDAQEAVAGFYLSKLVSTSGSIPELQTLLCNPLDRPVSLAIQLMYQ